MCGDPKTAFETYPNAKLNPLGPQIVKNDPKNNSKSKVRTEGAIEKKLFSYMSRTQKSF